MHENLLPMTEKEHNPHATFFKEILKFVIIAALVVAPIRAFIAQPFIVSGSSMAPTFENGQYLIVDELSYRFQEPQRGEVVVFQYPKDHDKYFIKRIIGLPGETVVIKDGQVSIKNEKHPQGKVLEQDYVTNPSSGSLVTTLAENEYFVLGDNRASSSDSRFWGALERDEIIGRSWLRLFPPRSAEFNPGKISEQGRLKDAFPENSTSTNS